MKKLFITILTVLGAYSITLAQKRDQVEFGVNVGYNAAYIVETGSTVNSPAVTGFTLGFSADYYFSDRWSIKGKLNYDQKGWGNGFLIASDGSEIDGVNFKLNYITIPVMANWHFGRKRNWYLHFGPYVGILLNATEDSGNTDVKDAFNTTDVGLDLGIGVKIPVSNNVKFFIEADGQGGVTNIFKDNSGGSIQNSRSSLNIGINFSVR